jgi:hypothetical protein
LPDGGGGNAIVFFIADNGDRAMVGSTELSIQFLVLGVRAQGGFSGEYAEVAAGEIYDWFEGLRKCGLTYYKCHK